VNNVRKTIVKRKTIVAVKLNKVELAVHCPVEYMVGLLSF
jgi:hypothetical protein